MASTMRHAAPQVMLKDYTGPALPRYPVSWLKRDLLLFASSIGCRPHNELHFLFEKHPNFAAFPTYPTVLPFKRDCQEVVDYLSTQKSVQFENVPRLDPQRVLDGSRILQVIKPLPVTSEGRDFEIRSKILGVYDKGKPGTVVESEQVIVDKRDNSVYTRLVGRRFFQGQGEWGGPRGPSMPTFSPPEGRENHPAATREIQLPSEIAYLYRLNGDYNPLHANPAIGTKKGFGGCILHGMLTWNIAARVLLGEWGSSNPSRLREFQPQFAAPVCPGMTLVIKMWKSEAKEDGSQEILFLAEADEIAPSHLRAACCALSTASSWLFNFLINEVTPVALSDISWRYFIVFATFNAIVVPGVYFGFPETAGRQLEEIDEIFMQSRGIFDPVRIAKQLGRGVPPEELGHGAISEQVSTRDDDVTDCSKY